MTAHRVQRAPSSARGRVGPAPLWVLLTIALISGGIALLADATHALRSLELSTIDARFALRGYRPPPRNIVLVALDARTLDKLGVRPPLRRSLQARLLERLHKSHPRLIADDFQFIGRTDAGDDRALIRALFHAKPVLLGTHDGSDGVVPVIGGVNLPHIGASVASVAVLNDPDGKVRRMLYAPVALKSFDVAAAELASGRTIPQRRFDDNTAWIDYRGPPGSFSTYSFVDVLAGRIPPSVFQKKIVIVGATDPIEKDIFPTPISDREMAGTEIHANAIATILDGLPLGQVPLSLDYLVVLLVAGLITLVIARVRPAFAVLLSAGGLAVLCVGAQLAFNRGAIISVTYPALALGLSTVGTITARVAAERREREHLRNLFARFVPHEVVDDVIASTDDDLRLRAIRCDGSVLFVDIREFTTFAEAEDADRVLAVVNRYFTEMSEAVFVHGGTLLAYQGDGIVACFGAPVMQPDHADRALAAAREMLTTRMRRLNDWLEEQHAPKLAIGIGLNSGELMAGNVGSTRRLEYTVIGDVPNVAARLEGMTKGSGYSLLISGETRQRLNRPPDELTCLGHRTIRGRTATIEVWGLGARSAATGDSAKAHR
ncbi:MAG: CHASE2 domain-containing protein [Solirubrobacteraceae bacterium]